MSDHQSFLDEIIANPDDDAPRLIYADWLEEQGNPRGEFIRVQCEMAGLKPTQKRYKELREREQRLFFKHGQHWQLPHAFRKCVYRRGFVEECAMALSYFIKNSEKYLRMTPLRDVVFTRMKDQLEKLAEVPNLGRLNSVHFKSRDRFVGETAFAESPHLAGLKAIRAAIFSNAALMRLAQSPHVGSLTSLELPYSRFDEQALTMVAESPYLANLERLVLTDGVDRMGIRKLCSATFAANLRELDIYAANIEDIELEMMLKPGVFPKLEVLRAGHYPVSILDDFPKVRGNALMALAESPNLANIRTLNLANHRLSYEAIEAIGSSQFRTKGARFSFASTAITRQQCLQLHQRFGKTFGQLNN